METERPMADCDKKYQDYVGYSFVPVQCFEELYCAEDALRAGTIFPSLNKPLGVYGNDLGGKA